MKTICNTLSKYILRSYSLSLVSAHVHHPVRRVELRGVAVGDHDVGGAAVPVGAVGREAIPAAQRGVRDLVFIFENNELYVVPYCTIFS